MTLDRFQDICEEQISRCIDVLCKKSEEYSTKSDKLHNFRLAAGLQNCGEKEALYGMWAKHLVSVSDMCRKEDVIYPMEIWEEKITDTINYALLLYAMVREEAEREAREDEID